MASIPEDGDPFEVLLSTGHIAEAEYWEPAPIEIDPDQQGYIAVNIVSALFGADFDPDYTMLGWRRLPDGALAPHTSPSGAHSEPNPEVQP